mmetsp:Transcript_65202/g.135911  ORF Transcript_65202/g.135911 Transcript_65202/m.135911 type:complete len:151 (-) Transcript_65202:1495-1947(-)
MASVFQCCGKRENHTWRGDTTAKPNSSSALSQKAKGKTPPPPPPGGPPQAERMCGVGVVFKPTMNADSGRTQLVVYSVAPASPAERSGLILPDDQLTHVDGTAVVDLAAEKVAPLVLGASGSSVTLRFKRSDDEFDVTLERSWGGGRRDP